ncbi:MAG: RNA ligase family protein, partial [Nitrososphaera sp.]|nr:RNA ligase family protein [Nitrososphaera sp.]
MQFRKYDHVERFGTDEVEGIEIGDVLVFPKLDGTNASVWRHQPFIVGAGSRNRMLSDENDNGGFYRWVQQQEWMRDFFEKFPDWTVYGEWLIPHTIKTYREEAWHRFWVFDVFDWEKQRYVHYDEYVQKMAGYQFTIIEPKVRYKSPPTEAQLIVDAATNTYLMEDGSIGEGIVVKNYLWTNKYGRQPWAKLVRNEFKEENKRSFGVTEKIGEKSIEGEIAEKYVTTALVNKTLAKNKLEGEFERRTGIPRLLQTVFYDLVREET